MSRGRTHLHSLGADRATLVRTQMTEALVLATLGGAGGVLLAWAGVPLLVRAAPEGVARLDAVGLDATAVLFTAGVSIVTACVFGLLPALRFSRPGLVGGLRQVGWIGSGPSHRGRDPLVVAQTAAALVLLVASGLLVQSFWRLSQVDPGYDTEDIFTFQIAPTGDDLVDGPSYARFHHGFMDRLAGLPGVQVGVVLGVLAALAVTRVLEALLFGVSALDPRTFLAISAIMLTVALMASYIPARRASSVDPMEAMRAE